MDNADLEKLKVSAGKLQPKFKASCTNYSVTVGSSVAEIKLTILTSDSGASYDVKGTDKGSKVVKLAEGEKLNVDIIVSAEDGTTTKTYSIAMRRLSADDATLSHLELSVGALAPPFNSFVYSYECYLPSSIDSVSLRAKSEDEAMKISMEDGSPVGSIHLNPGRTLSQINVRSVSGSSTTPYHIKFIKPRLLPCLQLKKRDKRFECAVCCGVVWGSARVKGGPFLYCHECLLELTKTNKVDPFTGKKLEGDKWLKEDYLNNAELGNEVAVCTLPNGKQVEGLLRELGGRVLAERTRTAEDEELTEACKDCSKKIPKSDLPLHKELLCTAQHPLSENKQAIKVMSWQKRMVVDSFEMNPAELMNKGLESEQKYLKSLPGPGVSPHYAPDKSPVDHLLRAARCYATALENSPKDTELHLALGLVLEEFFYLEDLFGMKQEEVAETEGEAERSSKEEEFLAICKLHGVAASAPIALQLKAVEAEYHTLKDSGQTHKAEHVQGLHAWKSKKIIEASQGSYSVNVESPLYRAKLKYQDAVNTSPSDGVACYHYGRLCLLLGERDTAKEHLMRAVALKPTFSPARFCLGFVLPPSASSHARNLLLHGLTQWMELQETLHETKAEPHKVPLTELHSKTIYRTTNTLMAEGFLLLSSLSGHKHLIPELCLLSVTLCASLAHLHHRASTYERLLWFSLQARALLLQLLHKQSDPAVLRHCRQLSALISSSELKPTPQLREMQLEVFQLGVLLQPSSSEALCHLGNSQLMQHDASNEASWLEDAELSFRASLEMEGKPLSLSIISEKLKQEGWWKKAQAKPTAAAEQGTKSTAAPATATGAANAGKKPAATGRQPPSAAAAGQGGGRRTGSTTPSAKTQGTTPARGGPAGRGAVKNTGGTAGAVRKPAGGAGQGSGGRVVSRTTGAAANKKSSSATTGGGGGGGGKSVATLGELKAGASSSKEASATSPSKTGSSSSSTPASPPAQQTQSSSPPAQQATAAAMQATPAQINKRSYHPRLGLARALAKTDNKEKLAESCQLYHEVIKMAPHVHDAYIEVGEILAKTDPTAAVEVYAKFPFSNPPTFDDAFLHGEIIRLLMKSESYETPHLTTSMIAMGKALGIGVLDKQVAILEGKFKSSVLKKVYAGIHGKSVDDPELQAFFKFKCWL